MSDQKQSSKPRRQFLTHRLRRMRAQGLKPMVESGPSEGEAFEEMDREAELDCGWGRLLFSQTFSSPQALAEALSQERPEQRDIAFYVRDPHVLLAHAPQDLFLDPSHTYRLDLSTYRAARRSVTGYFLRRLCTAEDAEAVNKIYLSRGMVPVETDFFWRKRDSRKLTHFLAEDQRTGEILGTITGIDHFRAFKDAERGSSLWCLAVDPQCPHPGVGEALIRRLAEHFQARGAQYLDLSVLHDNDSAISLYEKLGFFRVPFFAMKRKNVINEKLYSGAVPVEGLNPYAKIIVDEAMRRGIGVNVMDAEGGFFRLTYGGRSIVCRESLSELTSAIAMSRCDDKAVTRRMLAEGGLRVPDQKTVSSVPEAEDFLKKYSSIVVKPARGEQGRGVFVGVETKQELEKAISVAKQQCDRVLLEELVEGDDLRTIVIDYRLVAAAIRRPPEIIGDGRSTVESLIETQSRRRAAATQGESGIPIDEETRRCVEAQAVSLETVLSEGQKVRVRRTANLHTGGTIHDVTDILNPVLVSASIRAAKILETPVVGLDMMIKAPTLPEYAFIEANERPGLANHEPQPTAERFIDLLFPNAIPTQMRYLEEPTSIASG